MDILRESEIEEMVGEAIKEWNREATRFFPLKQSEMLELTFAVTRKIVSSGRVDVLIDVQDAEKKA